MNFFGSFRTNSSRRGIPPEGMGPAVFKVNPNHTDLNTAQIANAAEQRAADAETQRRRQLGGAVLKEVPMAVNNENTPQGMEDLMNSIQQASADAQVAGRKRGRKKSRRKRKTRKRRRKTRRKRKSRRKSRKKRKTRRRKN